MAAPSLQARVAALETQVKDARDAHNQNAEVLAGLTETASRTEVLALALIRALRAHGVAYKKIEQAIVDSEGERNIHVRMGVCTRAQLEAAQAQALEDAKEES